MLNVVRRVAGSLRARMGVVGTMLREHPRAAAIAVVGFVMRWSLRIALPLAGAARYSRNFHPRRPRSCRIARFTAAAAPSPSNTPMSTPPMSHTVIAGN